MSARLVCQAGELKGLSVVVADLATLGSAADNTVVLASPAVADHHAEIRWDGAAGCYLLRDLGSGQGTRLDGARVTGVRRLGALHVLSLGTLSLVFQQLEAEPGTASAGEGAGPDDEDETLVSMTCRIGPVALPLSLLAPSPPAPARRSRLQLEIWVGEERLTFPLVEGENRLGRGGGEIQVPSSQVSREHAVLTVTAGRVRVRDVGSTNGTFLAGKRLVGEQEVTTDASLSFGPLRARLVEEAAEESG